MLNDRMLVDTITTRACLWQGIILFLGGICLGWLLQ